MVNQQLFDYIKQQFQVGASKEDVKKSLLDNGWQEDDVEEALQSVSTPQGATENKINVQKQFSKKSVAAGVVIVALIAAGYFAWSLYFKKDALALAMEAAREVASYRFGIVLSDFAIDTQDPLLKGATISGNGTGEGWVDIKKKANQMKLTVMFRNDNPPEGQPSEVSATTENISIGDDIYTRTSLGILGLESVFSLGWLHMNVSDLAEELDLTDAQDVSTSPLNYLSILSGAREDMIVVAGPTEGGDVVHYRLEITPKYYETTGIADLPEKYRTFYESVFPVGSRFDVWINKDTALAERISFDLLVEGSPIGTMTITFSNINEPVSIEPPSDFVELNDLKKELEKLQPPTSEE